MRNIGFYIVSPIGKVLFKHREIVIGLLGFLVAKVSTELGIDLIVIASCLLIYGYFVENKSQHQKKAALYISLIGFIIIAVVFGYYHHRVKGAVHILNKQYEQKDGFGPLLRAFKKKYRIQVTIESPNPDEYSDILKKRYGGEGDYPTLFMVSGDYDFEKYKYECYDLTDTGVAKELANDDFALKGSDGRTYGLGFIVESFGITVNTTLLEDAGYKLSDIHTFSDLKHIVQDITSRKEKLGFAAFTTGTVRKNGYYRLAQHAPTVPLFYEMQDCGLDLEKHLEGTYMDAFQDYVDLCLDNATTLRQEAVDYKLKDAQQEFEEGKAVFHQDGSWSYKKLQRGLQKNNAGEMAVIPMYMGIEGEEDQGLNETCTYYWCVSKNAPKEDIDAALKFLKWMVTSKEGTHIVADQMGFQMPYRKALPPDNVYLKTLRTQIEDGYTPVKQYYHYGDRRPWVNALTNAIEAYASGTGNWDAVKKAFTTLW